MPQEPLTISVREACRWLGVGRDEGYRMVADGRLPALCVGPRIRAPRAAVERLIAALCAEQRLPTGPPTARLGRGAPGHPSRRRATARVARRRRATAGRLAGALSGRPIEGRRAANVGRGGPHAVGNTPREVDMKGSVRKCVATDGRVSWRAIYDLPPDPVTGKRRQKWLTARTKKDAEALLAEAIADLRRGERVEPSMTPLREYLTDWLAAIQPTVRPATYVRYRGVIDRWIVPRLGGVPLARLGAAQLQRAYSAWLAAGLAAETVRLHHGVLHRALDRVVRWQLLRSNPCDAVEPPKRDRPETATWTAEQAPRFLAATDDGDLAALWRLAMLTGMRRGELLALRWADLDLTRATVSVRRTPTRGPDGLTVGEPKSAAGQRAVALPPSCVAALRRHLARQNERRRIGAEAWHAAGLVFERGDGRLLHPNVAWATFRRLVARMGLPAIRFHDLRHTSATLAPEQGVHPKVVAERRGHSDVGMTLNRYSHVAAEMQRAAAVQMDELLRRLQAEGSDDTGSADASGASGEDEPTGGERPAGGE